MFRITETVKHLIIINLIFWIATLTIGSNGEFMNDLFALHFPANDRFKPWQIITHMFMHASYIPQTGEIYFMHILFNMFGLWMFGTPVERYLGRNKFLFLYFSAGLGAVLFQLAGYYYDYLPLYSELIDSGMTTYDIDQVLNGVKSMEGLSAVQDSIFREMSSTFFATMVGASGCIMGILAAFGVMNPNAELMLIFLPIPIKAKYFIPGIILLDVISAVTGQSFFSPSNTAYLAHIGGAVIGFIVMWYWKKNSFNKNRWD